MVIIVIVSFRTPSLKPLAKFRSTMWFSTVNRQPTRSLYQPHILVTIAIILLLFGLGLLKRGEINLSVNPFNAFRSKDDFLSLELGTPVNGIFDLFFPIDLNVSFNESTESKHFLGRYASFSAILSRPLMTKYEILTSKACEPLELTLKDTAVVVLRGDCTFVDKVQNIVSSKILPLAIIIANDEPFGGLITMYSSTFNQNGLITAPIFFIDYESLHTLINVASQDITLELTTANLGNWFGMFLSMILSPPLLIVIIYLSFMGFQKIRQRQYSLRNARMVQNLPTFVYNKNHMIDENHLETYLQETHQVITKHLSDESFPSSSNSSMKSISDLPSNLNILTSPEDFFYSQKCSICLEKYIPLETRVIALDCKHFYHKKCLSNWLINFKRTCPLCNKSLSSNVHHMLLGQVFHYNSTEENIVMENNVHSDEENDMGLYGLDHEGDTRESWSQDDLDGINEQVSFRNEPIEPVFGSSSLTQEPVTSNSNQEKD